MLAKKKKRLLMKPDENTVTKRMLYFRGLLRGGKFGVKQEKFGPPWFFGPFLGREYYCTPS
jgi:hypothetical protein